MTLKDNQPVPPRGETPVFFSLLKTVMLTVRVLSGRAGRRSDTSPPSLMKFGPGVGSH